MGDFEAAISALEGMLVISRRQPRVLFELGTLYQRLGAHRVAESYFARARVLEAENQGVTPFMQAYVVESEKQTSRNSWNGTVLLGLRSQSNPLSSPESSEIFSGGSLVPLNPSRVEDSDTNLQVFARVKHKYEFSSATALKSDALFYSTKYDEQTQLDYAVVELASGPEILFASTGDRLKLRPHLLVRESTLDGDALESTWGVGIDGAYSLGTNATVRGDLQFRERDYEGSGSTALRSGDEFRTRLNWSREIKRGHIVTYGFRYRDIDASVDRLDIEQLDLSARYAIRFANPIVDNAAKQSLSVYLIRRLTEYGAPDPSIHPTIVRDDREWRFGVATVVPLSNQIGVHLKLERSDRDSSLLNNEASNNLASIALRLTF